MKYRIRIVMYKNDPQYDPIFSFDFFDDVMSFIQNFQRSDEISDGTIARLEIIFVEEGRQE